MAITRRLLGAGHDHSVEGSSGLITRARLYEAVAPVGFAGMRRPVFDALAALSGTTSGDRVLDVGCGTGYLARRVAMRASPAGQVIGIDPSAPMIAYAIRTAPANAVFTIAAAQALPFDDAAFDIVVSTLALHHIPADGRTSALAEAARVLRPGGRLLITDFRPPRSRLAHHLITALAGHAMARDHSSELRDLVASAGFTITGDGDRLPLLHYVQARRPGTP